MTSETKPLGPAAPAPEADLFTLEPLRTEGPDALRTDPTDGMAELKLCKVQLAFESLPRTTLTCAAQDLHGCPGVPGPDAEPIPRGAKVTNANLTFLIPGCTEAHPVKIRPPATLTTASPEDTTLLRRFLTKHHFLRALGGAGAALLAILAALVPEIETSEDTPDTRKFSSFRP